jgi:hemerythrin
LKPGTLDGIIWLIKIQKHKMEEGVANMFEMKEEYKLGIPNIDNQHAKLFEIGESAYQLLMDTYAIDKYDKIITILEELSSYTAVHFRDEEEYMESINYRKLFSQKVDHADFIKKISEVDLNKIDKDQDEYIMEILNFLAKWLVNHIIEKDMLIVAK